MINKIESISANKLDYYIEKSDKNVQIVDVRDNYEYEKKHIKSAINISYEDIIKGMFNLSRDLQIIVYCDRGGKSMMAAKYLLKQGYTVKNVVGGLKNNHGKNIVQ